MHIFSPRNGAFKTHLSHERMHQNSRTAVWVLKNFPGVKPQTPIKGKGRREGWGRGRKEGDREDEMFQPLKIVGHVLPMSTDH
jgi:hypothetical protein